MSSSDGFDPFFRRQKMEKTRPVREEKERNVFIARQSRNFFFSVKIIKVLFRNCTFTWRVHSCFPAKEVVYIGETKVLYLKSINSFFCE